MKLSKAIEILEDYHKQLPRGVNDDYLDALQLGVQALKRVDQYRNFMPPTDVQLLPGETKD